LAMQAFLFKNILEIKELSILDNIEAIEDKG
jgi:hypothetical protein